MGVVKMFDDLNRYNIGTLVDNSNVKRNIIIVEDLGEFKAYLELDDSLEKMDIVPAAENLEDVVDDIRHLYSSPVWELELFDE
jgi:hypothetical protein